jgi:DNA-binding MarR family transcriptional regulator
MRQQARKKRGDQTLFDDPNMNLWILLDQTRDVVAKCREVELNQFQLTRVQAAVLYILIKENRGMTIAEISNWNLRELHSVLSLINRMAKIGFIRKIRNRESGKINVVITEAGVNAYINSTRRSIEMIFSSIEPEEKEQLESILKKIRAKGRELLGIGFKPAFLP